MGLRFRRTITILPGVRLNLSKSGISLSLGPRGASVNIGPRGTYANVDLPGSGLSYRKRLGGSKSRTEPPTAAARPEAKPEARYVERLAGLLRDRERDPVDWRGRVRKASTDDRRAWADLLQAELADEELPFPFQFDFTVDEENGRIWIALELPGEEVVPQQAMRALKRGGTSTRALPRKIVHALYEDACCALLLRVTYEIYRVLPGTDTVEAVGYRPERDPATGQPVRAVLLELATGRTAFQQIDLDHVDPSVSFEHLGGKLVRKTGELRPLRIEASEASSATGTFDL